MPATLSFHYKLQTEQTWTGIPVATTQGEQSYIKGNSKFMAVAVQVLKIMLGIFLFVLEYVLFV